jgi:hypothetical protein
MALAKRLKIKKILSPKEIQNKADEDADYNARSDRKVKTEAASLEVNITRQMPEPGNFSAECKQQSEGNDDDPQDYQSSAKLRHKGLIPL